MPGSAVAEPIPRVQSSSVDGVDRHGRYCFGSSRRDEGAKLSAFGPLYPDVNGAPTDAIGCRPTVDKNNVGLGGSSTVTMAAVIRSS